MKPSIRCWKGNTSSMGVPLFILLGLHPFQAKWQNKPYIPKGEGSSFWDSRLHTPLTSVSQPCSLSWLHSTRPLVWGGINATLLNVSLEWHSPNKAAGMLCHGMGWELAGHAENNKATSAEVLQECAPWKEKGEGGRAHLDENRQFENLSKDTALFFLYVSKIRR